METTNYYHLCADGAEAGNFIICDEDFRAAFNLVGVCAANCVGVTVLAFSIEDSHPHFLLYGTVISCSEFRNIFETSYKKYLVATRGSLDGVSIDFQLIEIKSEEHLMRVGTYVVNQPTKDGKAVMPYDYRWSSGPLYFRTDNVILVWCVKNGKQMTPTKVSDLTIQSRRELFHSKMTVPGYWLVCDGLILPQNYVDKERFEKIYRTHNCFRAFLSSGRSKDDVVLMAIAETKGITMDDLEIRKPCGDLSQSLFGTRSPKKLNVEQRLKLALELRKKFRISRRQIATLVRLPYAEVEKYIR